MSAAASTGSAVSMTPSARLLDTLPTQNRWKAALSRGGDGRELAGNTVPSGTGAGSRV